MALIVVMFRSEDIIGIVLAKGICKQTKQFDQMSDFDLSEYLRGEYPSILNKNVSYAKTFIDKIDQYNLFNDFNNNYVCSVLN
jgi:hypothetical protein